MLVGTEKITGTPQTQILLGNLEPIVCLAHDPQPGEGFFILGVGYQDAG